MPSKPQVPPEFAPVIQAALRALGPIRETDANTKAEKHFLISAKRTEEGRDLPSYYLVYFLFVDLLGFKNLGQSEKVSWSVPIDFHGTAYLIEHRKLGLGLFAHDPSAEREAAKEIVIRVQKAVKAARPFFDWLALQAVGRSEVNVVNNSSPLLERYEFLRESYRLKHEEARRRKDERIVTEGKSEFGSWRSVSSPSHRLFLEANWLAISVIEAFFSWTEHALIHVAVLTGRVTSAQQVADLAASDWSEKFKAAIDIAGKPEKLVFDKLLSIRQELRNYVAHGAFGKQGEAFSFHSGAGAVPVLLPHKRGSKRFTLGHGLQFDADAALTDIDEFIDILWAGSRAPARLYVQESGLPTILTFAVNGTYPAAMQTEETMKEYIEYWSTELDRAANMDW